MNKNYSELPPPVPYKLNHISIKKLIKASNSNNFDASILQQIKCSESFENPKLVQNSSQIFKPLATLPQIKKVKSFVVKTEKQKKFYDENPVEEFQKDLKHAEIMARNNVPVSSVLKKWEEINGNLPGQKMKFVPCVKRESDIQKEADYWFSL